MKLAARPALAGLALVLGLNLGIGACSGDDDQGPAPSGESAAPPQNPDDAPTFEIETRTTLGKVVGRLGKGDRRHLERAVTDVVQRWFNAAYVGGPWPRSDFHDAFPGFTPGARDEAHQDKALMTNISIGKKVEDVTPLRSRIWVDVLAVRRHAVGVTARFDLEFDTDGDVNKSFGVHGRLMLTRQDKGWKIFGYDVAKGGRA